MTTTTDAAFAARFSDLVDQGVVSAGFISNMADLANYVPSTSVLNEGLMSDIGRVTAYAPDIQDNFYDRFLRGPLSRGDSAMTLRVGEVSSYAFDPDADDDVLFGAQKPAVATNVAKKNLSRQIAVSINDKYLRQMCQTDEMIGDLEAAIMATSNACFRDDMWTACKEYFSGSMRSAKASQINIMTKAPTEAGFADELNELIWKITQRDMGYKSTLYNAAGFNTKTNNAAIALTKAIEFPAFRKLYADTFHPDAIRVLNTIDYVDSFATPAGAPQDAGELIGIIVDPRAYSITPMPGGGVTVETFRNPAARSTSYFTTYEFALQDDPFFAKEYIFAPKPSA